MTAAEIPRKARDPISDPESPRVYRVRVYQWDGYWSFEVTGPMVPFRDGDYLTREDAKRAARAFIEGHMRGESLNGAELERSVRSQGTNGCLADGASRAHGG